MCKLEGVGNLKQSEFGRVEADELQTHEQT
jgi:hypothetical protein